ncbi:MAG: NAD(P)-dependent alcohol dehydrogenase [Candidatus Limnocylindria bacterium]
MTETIAHPLRREGSMEETMQDTMKAIAQDRYGSPDVLTLREVARPEIGEDGVLVRVRAASVNALDWHFLRGEPYVLRLSEGLRRPKTAIRGVDVAGTVEAVGAAVTEFRAGDEVFGIRDGSLAEFVAGRESSFAHKPASLTFEQAAAVPVAGETALQGLRDRGQLKAGQKVLVYGAGGGVGTFAVQIAKALGADVTAVTSPAKADLVGSIGADRVIDYTRDDFTRGEDRYDVILDVGANRSLTDLRRALVPGGILVLAGGAKGRWIGPLLRPLLGALRARAGGKRTVPFLSDHRKEDLLVLKDMLEAGSIRPVIDRTYPLAEAGEAIRYLETGQTRGKVVVAV